MLAIGSANSLAHAQHAVNLLDAEPVENVGHESLESHVLDSCDIFRALEVVGCAVGSTLSGIVHNFRGESVIPLT